MSRWLGREPREVTTYEYDEHNRVVRAVTERESEWTDEDRGWLLAYLLDEDSRCPGCGNYLDECRDPKTAGKWRVVHQQCEACRIGEADAENRAEAKQRGLYTAVVLGS